VYPAAHANNVSRLVGSTACRLRIGDFRVIFEETDTDIIVTKFAPRGNVYDWLDRFMSDNDAITLTRAEYEDLNDAGDHALAMRDIASGAMETLTGAEVDAYLTAVTPLAFWRRHRALTQAELAARVRIAQSSLPQAETGRRGSKVKTYARLVKVLRTRIEDLQADERGSRHRQGQGDGALICA
jgi:DNA-binding XRE family transcriptional regulator